MENYNDYMEMARDVRKELETQRDIYITKVGDMDGYLQMLDAAEKACRETGKLKAEIETLQQQLAEERRQRTEMETRMNEMGKLSAGMARKAAQDDFHKALRTYLNVSKRKTIGKREAAKNVITDLMTSAKLELPDDIMEMLEHLDDEQTEPKNVTVNGNYVEAHNNGEVTVKS